MCAGGGGGGGGTPGGRGMTEEGVGGATGGVEPRRGVRRGGGSPKPPLPASIREKRSCVTPRRDASPLPPKPPRVAFLKEARANTCPRNPVELLPLGSVVCGGHFCKRIYGLSSMVTCGFLVSRISTKNVQRMDVIFSPSLSHEGPRINI